MKKLCRNVCLAAPLILASCAGARSAGNHHTAHATTFHLFGISIPGDDQEAAWAQVPEGAEVTTATSSPSDWSSIIGVLTNILGFSSTQVSWTGADPQ